ncbi:MAG: two-component system, NarL family, sensor kinase [bacterium]
MSRGSAGEPKSWLELLANAVGVGLAVLDEEGCYLFVNPEFQRIRVLPDGPGLAKRAPYGLDQSETAVRDVIDLARQAHGPILAGIIWRDGRLWDVVYVPIELDGKFAVGVVARDTTAREVALAEAEASASRHHALAEFSRRAVLAEDVAPLFDDALALLARELGVELAGVLELLPGGHEFAVRANLGFAMREDGTSTIVAAGLASHAGYTLSVGEPVVVEDLAAESRFSPPATLVDNRARSGIGVPIRAGSLIWGVLSAHTTYVRVFAAADVFVVRTVANVLGAAVARDATSVELKMLALQRRRLARDAIESSDRERRRLADVLHDEVLQHLLFARQECASLVSDETEPAVARLRQSLDDATRLLRDAVSDLHPITLAHVGLRATVESLAQEHAKRGGFDVRVQVDDDRPTPYDRLVVTAVRELLTNVVKHARASAVEVIVSSADDELVCEVADDGVGLDPAVLREAVGAGHIGLASLVERVEARGGRGELTTNWAGRGARIRLALPLP